MSLLDTAAGRATVAAVLGTSFHYADRAVRPNMAKSPVGRIAGAGVAFVGPVVVGTLRLRKRGVRLSPPPSALGKVMLGGYLLVGALAEELLWRKALTYRCPRVPRTALAAASGAGFVLAHIPRDGWASAAIHTSNTASWTMSAVLSGSIRWSVLSHWAYNCMAVSLRLSGTSTSRARP